ncbi:MAG: SIS domain-containing protein [Actinomycetota bacterium]|nr:SIS domain-containing protein [Actinomycetota bacterium]
MAGRGRIEDAEADGRLMAVAPSAELGARVDELLRRRTEANEGFFAAEADGIARLCHRMAERFARGGRLLAVGVSPQARSDARHVAVEFVHPVIVGKRALPALAIGPESRSPAVQIELLAEPDDMVIAFGAETTDAVRRARERRCLTIGFDPVGAEWAFEPPSDDAFVRQELAETSYHLLWELIHVFFEHKGLLEGRLTGSVHDVGASSFLYPFLSEEEHDLEAVTADVRASISMKAREVGELREQTLTEGSDELVSAAAVVRRSLDAGGKVLAFGNGGSATDATDVAADLRTPPHGWPGRRALDLSEDSGILTALANDIGPDVLFARQIIAYGQAGDVALALSTSGNSTNIVAALDEARRRGLATVALVGYDGGRVAADRLADHVVVSRSQHIPRIQEAQASAYHVLRELVEIADATARDVESAA